MLRNLLTSAAVIAFLVTGMQTAIAEDAIPRQAMNEKLRAMLPENIKEKGYIVAVNWGSYPPYEIVISPTTLEGASAEFATALGELYGVEIHHQTVSGLAAMLAGFQAGRFDMAIGPSGDFPDRRAKTDYIDWVKEYVAFAVPHGNPKNIGTLDDVCGLKIAVMAAGSAERVLKTKAEECETQGKPVSVQSFPDQNASILSVRSGRTDGFFSGQAPLTYFVEKSQNQLALAAANLPNGFGDIYQGAIAPKDSALSAALLSGFQELFDNGTYALIMKKWGLDGNMIKAPGINLAK
ncbi:ABC transporter substrate-binding protein [Pararhizobium qamdonense]|uniref:ABC transporter substrate-binding protein n=1 Tax=Pararhizobium qamdonense TaxID=3031126 RepID=UPI0023E1369B|nr:ABC transporter substrate-binding protein [Pararhizobium qamdonense]